MRRKSRKTPHLVPDDRWERCGLHTYEAFCAGLGLPVLKPEVDRDVAGRLERARKIAHHAFFEYEFVDVALEHSLLTLELMLRARLGHKGVRLPKLLALAVKTGALDERRAQTLRRLRNWLAHPTHDSFGGIVAMTPLKAIFDLANEFATESPVGDQADRQPALAAASRRGIMIAEARSVAR